MIVALCNALKKCDDNILAKSFWTKINLQPEIQRQLRSILLKSYIWISDTLWLYFKLKIKTTKYSESSRHHFFIFSFAWHLKKCVSFWSERARCCLQWIKLFSYLKVLSLFTSLREQLSLFWKIFLNLILKPGS